MWKICCTYCCWGICTKATRWHVGCAYWMLKAIIQLIALVFSIFQRTLWARRASVVCSGAALSVHKRTLSAPRVRWMWRSHVGWLFYVASQRRWPAGHISLKLRTYAPVRTYINSRRRTYEITSQVLWSVHPRALSRSAHTVYQLRLLPRLPMLPFAPWSISTLHLQESSHSEAHGGCME